MEVCKQTRDLQFTSNEQTHEVCHKNTLSLQHIKKAKIQIQVQGGILQHLGKGPHHQYDSATMSSFFC